MNTFIELLSFQNTFAFVISSDPHNPVLYERPELPSLFYSKETVSQEVANCHETSKK